MRPCPTCSGKKRPNCGSCNGTGKIVFVGVEALNDDGIPILVNRFLPGDTPIDATNQFPIGSQVWNPWRV